MRKKLVITSLSVLFLLTLSSIFLAQAVTYSLGVSEGDNFTWEVKTVDKEGIKEVMGYDISGNYQEGQQLKMQINGITDEGASWKVTVALWNPTTSSFSANPDSTTDLTIYKDPAMYYGVSWICPIPVKDYIQGIYGSIPSSYVELTDNSYALIFPNTGGKIKITYDSSSGILSSYQILKSDNTVVFDYSLISEIPGYEVSLLMGILVISIIGIIYIKMKKKIKMY